MDTTELLFLFEITIDEIISLTNAKNHKIRARFGDVFTLHLKDPNHVPQRIGRRNKKAIKIRKERVQPPNQESNQIAVVASDVESLVRSMLDFPIELTHHSKEEPYVLGVVEIPWTMLHIDYLKNLVNNSDQPPVVLSGTYKTYDEYTSKRVGIVSLTISVSQIKDNSALTKSNEHKGDVNTPLNVGTIRTIYSGGKLDGRRRKQKVEEKGSVTQNNKIISLDVVTEHSNSTVHDDAQKIDSTNESVKCFEVHNSESNQINNSDSNSDSWYNRQYKEIIRSGSDDTLPLKNDIEKVSRVNLFRSQHALLDKTDTTLIQPISEISKRWSNTAIEVKERLDTLNYIFGNTDGPFGNRVYCVEYFTVENNRIAEITSPNKTSAEGTPLPSPTRSGTNLTKTSASPSKTPDKSLPRTPDKTSGSETPQSTTKKAASNKHSMNICGKECLFGGPKNPCFENVCEIDLPEKAGKLISVTKCSENTCAYKKKSASLTDPFPDEIPILVDFGKSQSTKDCCSKDIKDVEVFRGMTANLIQEPCSCTCECTFGFITKTTYCNICGGFEVPGDELKSTRGGAPFPCPIYHGWQQKGKKGQSKKSSQTGDDSVKGGKGKSVDSDKESSKSTKKRKRKRDPRFKFNYGYKGIPPQIGHSQCAMPCAGDLYPVPKHMGWLWTADNHMGMKGCNADKNPFLKARPGWKPGAINKHVLRLLRMAQFPDEVNKRRRRDTGKKKRPLKRPLLIVEKKDGEYNITMETMKTFTKPRNVTQYPYEDKPLVHYKVGRTDEENAERKKRKERAQRRLEREQRAFLQSAFHDMCKEICLKTYQQALGQLPFAEDSWCPCYPPDAPPDRVDESHSCSCTDSSRSSGSMTDDDEWIIEFTPPNAYFNPNLPVKKVNLVDSATQYTYLDYRVKLLDHSGNQVPRYFTGPDGKQECSDLGGFWGPNKKWLEINVDGFIAPDGRWAPMGFLGPCGEYVDGEAGHFTATNGVTLTIGVDGYIDSNNQWQFYTKPNAVKNSKIQRNVEAWQKAGGCIVEEDEEKKDIDTVNVPVPVAKPKKQKDAKFRSPGRRKELSGATFSCFADNTSPRTLSQMGIAGHGHDRRILLSTLEQLLKQGEHVNLPLTRKKIFRHRQKKPKHTEPGDTGALPEKIYKPRKDTSKGVTAVNDQGQKAFFQLKDSPRAKQRILTLSEKGISLSSFHVPCFSSFINSQVARQQQLEHILRHNARVQNTAALTNGWRPGAISKRLLHKLNKAKQNTSTVSNKKPLKKQKKRENEDKPALVVAKRNGEYIVEMQVNNKNDDNTPCKPLIYKIASPDREERMKLRALKTQKLIEKARKEIATDWYNPDACEQKCGKAYKMATGAYEYDQAMADCICPEDMIDSNDASTAESSSVDSSDYSSLDLDWEIHFTPPNITRKEE
ncbi:hypothetical protein NE865_06024 [Phthorimaea operculella]|nr:hypothetical protein NE865_06024 [Phthorimaea operculella]